MARSGYVPTFPKLTNDEWERLHELAQHEDIPTSKLIGKVLRDFLEEHDPSDYGRSEPHSRRKAKR